MTTDIRSLLADYASEALTRDERGQLCAAALADQEFFDRLTVEESWRQLFNAPGVRAELLAASEVRGLFDAFFARFRQPTTPAPEDRIDSLYTELRALMVRLPEEPDLEDEVEHRFAELRQLQQEEAAAMRKRFESRLHLPPGAGWAALQEARRQLKINEDIAAQNKAADDQD